MINDVHENVLDGNVRSPEYDFLMWYDPAGAEAAHVRVQLALWLKLLWSVRVRSKRSGLLARMGLWSSCGGKRRNIWNFWGGSKKKTLPNKAVLRNGLDKCVAAVYCLYHWTPTLSLGPATQTDAEMNWTQSVGSHLAGSQRFPQFYHYTFISFCYTINILGYLVQTIFWV